MVLRHGLRLQRLRRLLLGLVLRHGLGLQRLWRKHCLHLTHPADKGVARRTCSRCAAARSAQGWGRRACIRRAADGSAACAQSSMHASSHAGSHARVRQSCIIQLSLCVRPAWPCAPVPMPAMGCAEGCAEGRMTAVPTHHEQRAPVMRPGAAPVMQCAPLTLQQRAAPVRGHCSAAAAEAQLRKACSR